MEQYHPVGGYQFGGDPWTYYPNLWEWLVKGGDTTKRVTSVVDVGCGEGHALRYFKKLGCEVIGLEQIPQTDPHILEHNFEEKPFVPNSTFDLLWSCEFVEHVDESKINNLVPVFKSARRIAMTHAFPGQFGVHHVNCQENVYWIDFLCRHGFSLNVVATLKAKEVVRTDIGNSHFERSGMIFDQIGGHR